MKRTITRRSAPEVNAGSMADIAFLLLIFFLVTTTIMSDAGILVKLPPWDEDIVSEPFKNRNVLKVVVNGDDRLLVENELIEMEVLRKIAKEFIVNPSASPLLAEAPNKAIVSLINDRGTSYEMYLQVYNELKAAYGELWEEAAERRYGQPYALLGKKEQLEIRKEIPFVISEAEPTEY